MKLLLLAAIVSLQLLAFSRADSQDVEEHGIYRRSVNPFARPLPPPRRPIITDDLRGVNRRFARSTDDDFQAFFNSDMRSIIHDVIHKVTEEDINDNGRSQDDEEHNRHRRNVNPFARPPPPRRPIITDDIRGAKRRWARDAYMGDQIEPRLHRERRDLQIPGYKKPTHHDVIIPNWNPNARTQAWQTIGIRRHRRDLEGDQEQLEVEELNGHLNEFEEHSRKARGVRPNFGDREVLINRPRHPRPGTVLGWRNRRDLQLPGYAKLTHRGVIIPNWNPNVRTQPWQHIVARNRRSYDSRSHASRGTSSSRSSYDTGRTHPGYNRRNA